MSQLSFVPASLLALAFVGFSGTASALVAPGALPMCGTGPACAFGFECTAVGGSGCAQPTCPPGADCEPVDCQPMTIYGCTPAHCTSDAECSPGMVCHKWEEPCVVTDCACAPDAPDCGCGAPTTCTPTTVSMCTPKDVLECAASADCGAGFNCEAQQDCACAGSDTGTAGSGTAGTAGMEKIPVPAPAGGTGSGGAAGDPIDPSCTCTTHNACVVQQMDCKTNADCLAGWTCVQEPAVGIARPACSPDMPCDPLPEPEPMPTTAHCLPPYYGANSSGGLSTPNVPGSTETGGGYVGPTPKPGTVGSAGTTSTGPGGTTANNGTAGNGSGESRDVAACSIGHGSASTGALSLLAMLGALIGLGRRRARR